MLRFDSQPLMLSVLFVLGLIVVEGILLFFFIIDDTVVLPGWELSC